MIAVTRVRGGILGSRFTTEEIITTAVFIMEDGTKRFRYPLGFGMPRWVKANERRGRALQRNSKCQPRLRGGPLGKNGSFNRCVGTIKIGLLLLTQ